MTDEARAGEPDHDGYIDEFGDERQARAGEPVGPVRIRSANCAAGDHDDCVSMVEQDVPELGITDCLCDCHADEAIREQRAGEPRPSTEAGRAFEDALRSGEGERKAIAEWIIAIEKAARAAAAPLLDVERLGQVVYEMGIDDLDLPDARKLAAHIIARLSEKAT